MISWQDRSLHAMLTDFRFSPKLLSMMMVAAREVSVMSRVGGAGGSRGWRIRPHPLPPSTPDRATIGPGPSVERGLRP